MAKNKKNSSTKTQSDQPTTTETPADQAGDSGASPDVIGETQSSAGETSSPAAEQSSPAGGEPPKQDDAAEQAAKDKEVEEQLAAEQAAKDKEVEDAKQKKREQAAKEKQKSELAARADADSASTAEKPSADIVSVVARSMGVGGNRAREMWAGLPESDRTKIKSRIRENGIGDVVRRCCSRAVQRGLKPKVAKG